MNTVRRLGPADAAAYRVVRLDGLARHPDAFGESLAEGEANDVTTYATTLESAEIWGGFLGDALAGLAGLDRRTGEKSRHQALLWGMYVTPEARGTGLGDALVRTVLESAAAQGIAQVHLGVGTHNEPALALYRRHGFVAYAREPRALVVGSRALDEFLMVRMLDGWRPDQLAFT